MKKLIRKLFKLDKECKEEKSYQKRFLMDFSEVIPIDSIIDLLRNLSQDNPDYPQVVRGYGLNDEWIMCRAYFAGATLCLDLDHNIESILKKVQVVTLTKGSIGFFNPDEVVEGARVMREDNSKELKEYYKLIYSKHKK